MSSTKTNSLLIPPFRYAVVEEGFYRGAYPTLKNFRFLRRLQLKTIVSLTPESQPNRDTREFCRTEGIALKHLYVDKYQQDGVTLTRSKVMQVLQLAIEPRNLPLYLHCLDGTHVTGLVVTCFRKLQSWTVVASTAEFCKFQKNGEITPEESHFLGSFQGEIEIPPRIPPWLWQGVRTVRHPTFKLRFLPAEPSDVKKEHSVNLQARIAIEPVLVNEEMLSRSFDAASLKSLPLQRRTASGEPAASNRFSSSEKRLIPRPKSREAGKTVLGFQTAESVQNAQQQDVIYGDSDSSVRAAVYKGNGLQMNLSYRPFSQKVSSESERSTSEGSKSDKKSDELCNSFSSHSLSSKELEALDLSRPPSSPLPTKCE